jgi:hypothetical protein
VSTRSARDGHPGGQAPAQRGSTAGAVVFGIVLAAILVGGYLWLTGRRDLADAAQARHANGNGHAGAADKWTSVLGKFLAKGPKGGTWETTFLSCVYTHYLGPHPDKPDLYLIAEVKDGQADKARAVSRWLIPRHFFRAPAPIFFSNYTRSGAPVREQLDGRTNTWRVQWRPRSNFEGLVDTERRVWFSIEEGDVVQVEDRSRTGTVIRRIRRTSKGTGTWDPAKAAAEAVDTTQLEPPDPHADPERTLASVVGEAPFPVYVPRYRPPGFVLVRSSYTVFDPETLGQDDRVQIVSQLYSDGLALISLGIAPSGDMGVIEQMMSGMADPGLTPCPGLPTEPRDIRHDGVTIRMRTDSCRTVVRRDDLAGISVTLIGRNELPSDEYLRMIGSLEVAK